MTFEKYRTIRFRELGFYPSDPAGTLLAFFIVIRFYGLILKSNYKVNTWEQANNPPVSSSWELLKNLLNSKSVFSRNV